MPAGKQAKTTAKAKSAKPAVDKQRKTTAKKNGRTPQGQFAEGNQHGFQPGQSGNPAGRPKGIVFLSEAYRAQLAKPMPGDVQGRTYAEVIAETVCSMAATGNFVAAKEVADRSEGKAKQTVDVTLTRTEADRYERMIARLIEVAATNGTPISREEAIQYLAHFDQKVLAAVHKGGLAG